MSACISVNAFAENSAAWNAESFQGPSNAPVNVAAQAWGAVPFGSSAVADQTCAGCCSKDGPGEGADFATGNNCFGSINDGVF
ncbi:unnamed protein product, partial [Effrenium voratum]